MTTLYIQGRADFRIARASDVIDRRIRCYPSAIGSVLRF